jgi:hypothetical protein
MSLYSSTTGKSKDDRHKLATENFIRPNAKNELGYVALYDNFAHFRGRARIPVKIYHSIVLCKIVVGK